MNSHQRPGLFMWGGISGITGTLCYIMAIALPLTPTVTYAFAVTWPVLTIIFIFSVFRYIELERQSAANQLAFVFACLAFTLVAAMISSQLAVRIGIQEMIERATAEQGDLLRLMRRPLRLVDMGIDVAWDIFIGTALIFLGFALKGHLRFGIWWGITAGTLGVLLIVLNVITFPWPPADRGLVDVGPVIGLFIIALSLRLSLLGYGMKNGELTHST